MRIMADLMVGHIGGTVIGIAVIGRPKLLAKESPEVTPGFLLAWRIIGS
jgi:hypothetical protein